MVYDDDDGHQSIYEERYTTLVFGQRKCVKQQNNFAEACKLFGLFIHMVKEKINQEGVWRFGIKSCDLFKRQNGTQKGKLHRAVSCSLKLATLISLEAVAALQSVTRYSVKSDKQVAVQGWNHQRRQVLQHYKVLSLSN